MGLSLSLEQGHEGRIREVPQEDRCSSMYSNYCAFTPNILMHSHTLSLFLLPGNLIHNIN
jgi:hypothetical protein